MMYVMHRPRTGPLQHPQYYEQDERMSIMRKLRAEGKSMAEIARQMNCDVGSIHYYLRRYGEKR